MDSSSRETPERACCWAVRVSVTAAAAVALVWAEAREAAREFTVEGVVALAPRETEMRDVEIWPVALSRTWTVKEPLVGAKGSFVAAVLSSAAVGSVTTFVAAVDVNPSRDWPEE